MGYSWSDFKNDVGNAGAFVDPTNTSSSSGIGNVVGNADFTNDGTVLNEVSDFVGDNKGAIAGGVGGFLIGGPAGAVAGAGAGAAYDSNTKATEAQTEAVKESNKIIQETSEKQLEVVGETKDELIANNEELLAYADEKNIEVRDTLKEANAATAKILLEGLATAKTAEKKGLQGAADQILESLGKAETFLLNGEEKAKNAELASIKEATNTLKSTLSESKDLFAPWIKNGQWASDELRNRSEELTRKFTLDDFKIDPGYQQRLKEGQKSILNYGSSIGITGNTAKDLVKYSQDFASNEVDRAYVRFRDFQDNAILYLKDISNQGKSAAIQYSDILKTTNSQLADLDLAKGNTLSNYLRNTGIIRSDTERSRGGVRSDLTLANAGIDKQYALDTAGINAGLKTDQGNIQANYIQQGINDRKETTANENALISGAAGNTINILGNQGANQANTALTLGQIQANKYNNQAALINNTLKNYLFYKYAGLGGGGNAGPTVAGAGSQSVNSLFPAAPDNMGYTSPYLGVYP